MSTLRRRIERLELDTADIPKSVCDMTDDQLAAIIGGPGTRAAELSREELMAIAAGEPGAAALSRERHAQRTAKTHQEAGGGRRRR